MQEWLFSLVFTQFSCKSQSKKLLILFFSMKVRRKSATVPLFDKDLAFGDPFFQGFAFVALLFPTISVVIVFFLSKNSLYSNLFKIFLYLH